jgi:hypothetical protein
MAAAESLPSYEALDELVDGDPNVLRDVAWKLRNRLADAEAALATSEWHRGTVQARLDDLRRTAAIWRAWWDGKGGQQCANLAAKVDWIGALEREPAGDPATERAAYARLETAARTLTAALENLHLVLPKQSGKSALFDAYWAANSALAAIDALPAPEVTP